MSEVSDAATVRLLLADFAAADPQNKLNIIGGGLTLVGFNPQVGLTVPFGLAVSVGVPSKLYDAEASVEIILEDAVGDPVTVPAPVGPPQPMRVGQAITFEKPSFPGVHVPSGLMGARMQWVLGFNTGLPLPPGQRYVWRVKIDHDTRDDWTEEFYVPGPKPQTS